MRSSDLAKVGLTVLVGITAFIVAIFWLRGSSGIRRSYLQKVSFPSAQGIQKGAPVRVRGVDMGVVERVELGTDPQKAAVLTLRVSEDYRIRPEDAIRIVAGLVSFSPPFVEITPGGRKTAAASAGGILPGETGSDTDALLSDADQLLKNLNTLSTRMTRLTDSLARVAEDPSLRRSLLRTASNFEKVSDSGLVIARNMEHATGRADQLVAGFQSTAANLNRTLARADHLVSSFQSTAGETRELVRDARGVMQDTRSAVGDTGKLVRDTNTVVQNAGGLVTDTRAALTENRERLRQVFDNLNTSLKQLDSTLTEARSFIADPQLRQDLKTTAENVRDATSTLKQITTDVRGITGDPKVQEDLKASIAGLRDATEQAADLFERVRGVLGTGGKTAKSIGQRISDAELDAELVHRTRRERTRIDFDATIPWSDSIFYRVGFFDFGEGNKFNAQRGQLLTQNLWARYGVRASSIGLGLDVGNRRHPAFSLDFFGVDHPRLDARSNIQVVPGFDLTLGLDNIFRRPDPIFGIRYHR